MGNFIYKITNIVNNKIISKSKAKTLLQFNFENICYYKQYKIIKLPKSVSTIPDECKGVEPEISTGSKRQTILS